MYSLSPVNETNIFTCRFLEYLCPEQKIWIGKIVCTYFKCVVPKLQNFTQRDGKAPGQTTGKVRFPYQWYSHTRPSPIKTNHASQRHVTERAFTSMSSTRDTNPDHHVKAENTPPNENTRKPVFSSEVVPRKRARLRSITNEAATAKHTSAGRVKEEEMPGTRRVRWFLTPPNIFRPVHHQ
jgi:hypothetical protein